MNSKEKYRQLCEIEKTIPVFSRDWWMDAVCGDEHWDVILVEKGGQIIASLPYYMRKKWGFKFITQPQFTQNNGIWIKYPTVQKYCKRVSHEKSVMTEIIEQIDALDIDYYYQHFHYSITNWLPFYWKGFDETTRYTYVLEDLRDFDRLLNNFSHAKRTNIRKAREMVKVRFDISAEEFYANHKMTLYKQNCEISYPYKLFKRIYGAAYERNMGRTIYAVDDKDNIHAALFIIWDDMSAYALISTIDPDFRNSGAASLLIYEILKYIKDYVNKFDFEGSMIENVENSYRQFGAMQKPYFNITKTYKKTFKLAQLIKHKINNSCNQQPGEEK